jgi:flavodoxin
MTDIPGTLLKLTKEADNNLQESARDDNHSGEYQEEIVNMMFYWLWLKNRFTDETRAFMTQVLDTEDIDWSIKALMVSALTLSQLRHFDREKLYLLFDLTRFKDPEVRQRAIVGLFISILAFQKRIVLYQDILNRLKSIPDDPKMQERMLAILLQYIRASETEKITKKIQQEIVPEVLKIKSELEEKLNLDELLAKEKFDEKNPEWKNFFQDSPDVYQKLEQFSKMQIEGADVFMGAFALLKHFDFFRDVPNWFIPFKAGNRSINKAVQGSEGNTDFPALFGGLEKSTVLCNPISILFV